MRVEASDVNNIEKKESKVPKISIVVPVCNDAEFLDNCISSVCNQTLEDIEIICIDDASSDESFDILSEYEKKDDRVHIIRYSENSSASQARKDGSLSSKGEYIMFLDGDDWLDENACKELYQEITTRNVDILQFGTNIVNWSGLPKERIESNQRALEPYLLRLEGKEVFEACFKDSKYSFNLWNKIYRGDLVRRAANEVLDGSYPKAQDMYLYFIIAFFSRSYEGITDKYYYYRFGSGITGHNVITPQRFNAYCEMKKVIDALDSFLERQDGSDNYDEVKEKYRHRLTADLIFNWAKLPRNYRQDGIDKVLKSWDQLDVISAIERQHYDHLQLVEDGFVNYSFPTPQKEIKTIATFYHRAYGGGAQKVMVQLANLWVSMGYRVVIITEDQNEDLENGIGSQVIRCTIPKYSKGTYKPRGQALLNILQENDVDVMVYHAWSYHALPWDLLLSRINGVRFVIYTHSIFAISLISLSVNLSRMVAYYRMADSIITLNDADTAFWNTIHPCVYQTVNLFGFNNSKESERNNRSVNTGRDTNIIWVGRFSKEKRPMDAIKAFDLVHKAIPETRLLMLGEISDADKKYYEEEIQKMGIHDAVSICGYRNDIDNYYNNASVMIVTSEYEGFHLGIAEGFLHGVPCVMYDLPYLSWLNDCDCAIKVEFGNQYQMADEICELLRNDIKRKNLSDYAVNKMKKMMQFDHSAFWKKVLEDKEKRKTVDEGQMIMTRTLLDFYGRGVAEKNRKKLSVSLCSILNRKLVYWGSGRNTSILLNDYPDVPVEFCIDNDVSKKGKKVGHLGIKSLDDIDDIKDYFIIITPTINHEIVRQLEDLGLRYAVDFVNAKDVLEFNTL